MSTPETTIRPLIGLTTYLEEAGTDGCGRVSSAFLPEKYFAPLLAAGAIPVLLPPQPALSGVAEQLIGTLDGLLVPGGWDVDPARYGQEAHPETDSPRPARDEWEQALILEAIRQDVPLLTICRGEQLLNVTLGGTLHQHLPDIVGEGVYQLGGHQFNKIEVEIKAHSLLNNLLGEDSAIVPVSHHQAVDRLGDGLVAAAWSEDQIVEAIEHPGQRFCLGVQWHPEQLPEEEALFRGFVAASREQKVAKVLQASVVPASAAPVDAVTPEYTAG
jgi:putative glutamine amidotransferase